MRLETKHKGQDCKGDTRSVNRNDNKFAPNHHKATNNDEYKPPAWTHQSNWRREGRIWESGGITEDKWFWNLDRKFSRWILRTLLGVERNEKAKIGINRHFRALPLGRRYWLLTAENESVCVFFQCLELFKKGYKLKYSNWKCFHYVRVLQFQFA